MKGAIIANGECLSLEFLSNSLKNMDYIICLDGGLNTCEKLNLNPDIIAGDFDSVDIKILEKYEKQNIKIKRFPTRKDLTDMEIGIETAAEQGITELFIFNALGKRLDHTWGNIGNMLLALKKGMKPVVLDENQEIHIVNSKISFKKPIGTVISLIPISPEAKGVKTAGLDYPLNNETLYIGQSRGVSNIIVEEDAWVSLEEGILLVFINTVKNYD